MSKDDQQNEEAAHQQLIANKEIEKVAYDLANANTEIAFQNEEKQKRANELAIANTELAYQNKEKQKRANELVVANTELAYQNEEKQKRANELAFANIELAYQNKEKQKRARELVIANKEKESQHLEKQKRAHELVIANQEKENQYQRKQADQIALANKEIAFEDYRCEMERVARDLTLLVDTANAPIFGVDTEYNVNEWNQKSAEVTGFKAEEVLGKNLVSKLITKGYRSLTRDVLRKALDGDNTSNFEFLLTTKSKKRVKLLFNATTRRNEDGFIVGVVGVGQDITELDSYRSEMELKVKERTRELDTIFTLSPDGFVLVDVDNKIVSINPAFIKMTGIKAQQLLGKSAAFFNKIMTSLFDKTLMEKTNLIRNKDGEQTVYIARPTPRTLNCNRKTMVGLFGDKEGQVLYFRDITHESEVAKMKSDFLSTAAHELRTPLASIYGYSELLLTRDFTKKVSNEIVETIHRQSQNIKNLLNELLDLSRIEARSGMGFYMVQDSLESVVTESCAEVEGAYNGRIVQIEVMRKWPVVSFDIDKIRQVFINLLSNAFKYSDENCKVVLKTSTRTADGNQQFGVSIVDYGIGMTPRQLARLGERFYRADDSGVTSGTGLGISLVKEIMSIHGGETEFISGLGKGTTSTVWLPIISKNVVES